MQRIKLIVWTEHGQQKQTTMLIVSNCVNDTIFCFKVYQSPKPGIILTDSISLSVADMSPIFVSHVIKPSSVDSLRRCCKGVRAHMYPRRGHGVEVSMTPPLVWSTRSGEYRRADHHHHYNHHQRTKVKRKKDERREKLD